MKLRLSPTIKTQIGDLFLHLGHATRKGHAPKHSRLQQPTHQRPARLAARVLTLQRLRRRWPLPAPCILHRHHRLHHVTDAAAAPPRRDPAGRGLPARAGEAAPSRFRWRPNESPLRRQVRGLPARIRRGPTPAAGGRGRPGAVPVAPHSGGRRARPPARIRRGTSYHR